MNIGDIDPRWWWVLAAALLALAELAAPGIFLVWIAAAAVVTSLVAFAGDVGLPTQLIVFGLSSIAMVLLARYSQARTADESSDPLLNDRAARLVGREVTVNDPILNGEGRVRVGDGIWNARGPDAPAGARVRIMGAEGGYLVVTPVDGLPNPSS